VHVYITYRKPPLPEVSDVTGGPEGEQQVHQNVHFHLDEF